MVIEENRQSCVRYYERERHRKKKKRVSSMKFIREEDSRQVGVKIGKENCDWFPRFAILKVYWKVTSLLAQREPVRHFLFKYVRKRIQSNKKG